MARPINQELYILHRPARIVEADDDAVNEILSGYSVAYSYHFYDAQHDTARQQRGQADLGRLPTGSFSTPSLSPGYTGSTENALAIDVDAMNSPTSKSDVTVQASANKGTWPLTADGAIMAGSTSRAA